MATVPVRVAVRVRPMLGLETSNGCAETLRCMPDESSLFMGISSSSPKQFTYDFVYPGSEEKACGRLYDECVSPLLDGCLKGLNATVLAYGQTGSGKTYTMGTDGKNMEGVIPRVAKDLFSRTRTKDVDDESYMEYSIKISFLEIYREEIRDLLNGNNCLNVREDMNGSVFVHDLSEEVVENELDMQDMILRGCKERATGSTNMNATSSRSHAIITLTIRATNSETKEGRISKLHLVDLAGSERAKRTKAEGQRLQEGIDINKGLLCLGNVISALGDESKGPQIHIPYRDSKLTRLLQDSLGGNSRTVMIACASPADINFDETMNTLKYANRARNIKNKPTANKEDNSELQNKLIVQLRQEVSRLENELLTANNRINPSKTRETCNAVLRLSERNAYLESVIMQLQSASENVAVTDQLQSVLKDIEISPTVVVNEQVDEDDSSVDDTLHVERQLSLQNELKQVSEEIEAKAQAINQIETSDTGFEAMRKAFGDTMEQMCKDVEILQKERDDLKQKLTENWKPSGKSEDTEKRSQASRKLASLEDKIKVMKKKIQEQDQLLKIQSKGLKGTQSLKQDIVQLKQAKVKLLKRIKAEADEFRKEKKMKNKQIQQLQKEKSKEKITFSRIQRNMEKQNNVLQRKAEQAQAAQKRLKALLDKQKQRKQYLNRENSSSTNKAQDEEKWKKWVIDQSELAVETFQLRRSLKQEMNARKEISESNDEEAESKKIECSKRISNLQTLLFEIEEETKRNGNHPSKQWSQIRSLSTSKCVLKTMFKRLVETMDEKLELEINAKYATQDIKNLEDLLQDTCHKYEMEKASILRECDQKLVFLMNKIPRSGPVTEGEDHEMSETFNFQKKQIESLSEQNKNLVEILETQNSAAIKKKLKEMEKKKQMEEKLEQSDSADDDEPEWWSNDDLSSSEDELGDNDSDWTENSPKKKQIKKRKSSERLSTDVKPPEQFNKMLPVKLVDRIDGYKVKQLQSSLRYLGLHVTGRKDVLKTRLLDGLVEKLNRTKCPEDLLPEDLSMSEKKEEKSSEDMEGTVIDLTETEKVESKVQVNQVKNVSGSATTLKKDQESIKKIKNKTNEKVSQNLAAHKENRPTNDLLHGKKVVKKRDGVVVNKDKSVSNISVRKENKFSRHNAEQTKNRRKLHNSNDVHNRRAFGKNPAGSRENSVGNSSMTAPMKRMGFIAHASKVHRKPLNDPISRIKREEKLARWKTEKTAKSSVFKPRKALAPIQNKQNISSVGNKTDVRPRVTQHAIKKKAPFS